MATKQDAWTPYGLEAIRIRHLRRRRIASFLIVLALAGMWSWMFESTTVTEQEIFANGRRVGSGISIPEPEQEPVDDGPVTVAISPGRVTRADTSQAVGGSEITRADAQVLTRAPPYNWSAYILMYGPFALLAAAMWFLGKRQKAQDEVNFGIYKGAMPLELMTASARSLVLTRKEARTSIFGKRRRDHVPAGAVLIERVVQEDDE